jgi:hypothetical protein
MGNPFAAKPATLKREVSLAPENKPIGDAPANLTLGLFLGLCLGPGL